MAGYILMVVQDPERLAQEITVPPNMLVMKQSSVRTAVQTASHLIPTAVLTEHTLPDGLGTDDLVYYEWLGITWYLPSQAVPGQINQVLKEVLADRSSRHLVSV